MSMTDDLLFSLGEAEAKRKMCPLVATPDEFYSCVASECMAWRWVGVRTDFGDFKPSAKGYCGIVGSRRATVETA